MAHRILRDTDLAEDATQQALLTIWRDLPQLRDPARFDAWSYRLLVRACYAEGRRTRRWAPNLRLLPADEPAVAEGLSSVVDRDQLERGFRRLSIDHRAVVVLHHYLDLPLDEVAEDARRPRRDGPIPTTSRDARPARGPRGRRPTDDAGGCPMSTDRDVTRIVRSWLEEGVTALPDRVLDTVLDQLPATPQRRAWWPARRLREMNNFAKLAIAAAAVVIIAIVGINLLPTRGGIGGPGGPSPSPTPSPSPQARMIVAGSNMHFTAEYPAAWAPFDFGLSRDGDPAGVSLFASVVDNTFSDPCAHVEQSPKVGPTVERCCDGARSHSDDDRDPACPDHARRARGNLHRDHDPGIAALQSRAVLPLAGLPARVLVGLGAQ